MALPDVADLDLYGGAKENYMPVEDHLTDEDADDRNEYVSDVAGMTQTACRAWCAFVGNATTPTDPASNVHGAVWGNSLSLKPTVARTGAGVYTVTWPTQITDALGTVRNINLRRPWASVEGSTLYFTTATVTSPNVVTVRVFNTSFAANDAVGVTLCVFAT